MKKYPVQMIISGGQTGVDRAALDFALEKKIVCGGWCPLGRRAEDGRIPEKYPLKQASSELYQHRTRLNVRDSDATLIITDGSRSRGTMLTGKCARQYCKPLYIIGSSSKESIEGLLKWLEKYGPRVLNIAGPRGSEGSGIESLAMSILKKSLKRSRIKPPDWPPLKPDMKELFDLVFD